ncbi:MAG TPA: ABC transporter substrate-binding protein [Chloroflexota bacterium]|nr:ABC transporter substrate-binding protein [Chloroflexota bacterium]
MSGATHSLTRRRFVKSAGVAGLGLLAGCGRLPWQAEAPAKIAQIGYLAANSTSPAHQAFREGLRELGWIEGQNILIEWRLTEGREEQVPQFAAELARLPLDAIVVVETPRIHAVQQETRTIPVVMISSGDPVSNGFVASLSRPGGNITGVSNIAPQLSGKRLELLKETIPGASRVAILWDPTDPGNLLAFQETQAAAERLAIHLQSLEVRDPGNLSGAFETATRKRADGVVIPAGPVAFNQRMQIVELTAQHRLPAMYAQGRLDVEVGGLMWYAPSNAAVYRRAAYYVDRILKGAKPADLPVEQPREFDFVINLRTAQALGLTIPRHVLLQATEIIQ